MRILGGAALVLLLAACGSTAQADFAAKANIACDAYWHSVLHHPGATIALHKAALQKDIAQRDKLIATLDGLTPPSAQVASVKQFTTLLGQIDPFERAYIRAITPGHIAPPASVTTPLAALVKKAQAVARRLGLPNCVRAATG